MRNFIINIQYFLIISERLHIYYVNVYVDCNCIYISGVGCYWDGLFVGALGYADDLILLAPSPSALRLMLNLCESFAYSYGLKFNASKTQLIRFGLSLSNTCNARIVFCGEQLVFLNTVCHLGHHLSYNTYFGVCSNNNNNYIRYVFGCNKKVIFFISKLCEVMQLHVIYTFDMCIICMLIVILVLYIDMYTIHRTLQSPR